jgi:hypothetical protein
MVKEQGRSMNEEQKQTTEGIAFRIPSNSLHELREESKKKQVSLNTLVNQILKQHLDWHAYADQTKMHHLPRVSMSRIIDRLTDDQLSEIAIEMARKDFVDLGLLFRGEFTISSFLNIAETWSRISAFPYKHEINNDVHNFIIEHDMGRKYSFLIKEICRFILEERFETKSEFMITDNTVVFKFRDS